jgi:hypothetical protein
MGTVVATAAMVAAALTKSLLLTPDRSERSRQLRLLVCGLFTTGTPFYCVLFDSESTNGFVIETNVSDEPSPHEFNLRRTDGAVALGVVPAMSDSNLCSKKEGKRRPD